MEQADAGLPNWMPGYRPVCRSRSADAFEKQLIKLTLTDEDVSVIERCSIQLYKHLILFQLWQRYAFYFDRVVDLSRLSYKQIAGQDELDWTRSVHVEGYRRPCLALQPASYRVEPSWNDVLLARAKDGYVEYHNVQGSRSIHYRLENK